MTDHKKPGVAFWATVMVVGMAAIGAYAAAYFWMVQPDEVVFLNGGGHRITANYSGEALGTPGHRDQRFWEKVFGPAHWIDRRIRSHTWTAN